MDKLPDIDCYGDDDPTIKIHIPTFEGQVTVEANTEDPNFTLVLCAGFGIAAVIIPAYYFFLYWIVKYAIFG